MLIIESLQLGARTLSSEIGCSLYESCFQCIFSTDRLWFERQFTNFFGWHESIFELIFRTERQYVEGQYTHISIANTRFSSFGASKISSTFSPPRICKLRYGIQNSSLGAFRGNI